jgi:acyl-CoA thioester hydrolase
MLADMSTAPHGSLDEPSPLSHLAHLSHLPAGTDETLLEIRYGETDQMGYAHHSTAVLWFEYGRVHWLRKRGLKYRDLEAAGILLPVIELSIKYHAPGRFEDQIAIRTTLVELSRAQVRFETRILRCEADGSRTLLVTGSAGLVCIDRNGKIQRVPAEFVRLWEQSGGAGVAAG